MSGPASGPKSLTEVKVLMVQVRIWSMCDTDMWGGKGGKPRPQVSSKAL